MAAWFAGDLLEQRIRRVVIKTRLVILASTSSRTVQTDLRHIVRNGVTPDGARGAASAPDLNAFEHRGRGDRHQFRESQSEEEVAPPPDTLTLPMCTVRLVYIPDPFATFIFPRAAFNPAVTLPSSSFAQKCMKNKRGWSFSMWLCSAVISMP